VLFGAELSFANQHVDNYEFEAETKNISPFSKKILSLYIMHLLISHFERGEKPLNADEISKELQMPASLANNILHDLFITGLVSETETQSSRDSAYQPAFDIHKIRIKTVLDSLEHKGSDELFAEPSKTLDKLKEAVEQFNRAIGESDHNKLLKDV